MKGWVRAGTLLSMLFLAACAPVQDGTLPTGDQVVAAYEYSGQVEADIVGNVAVLTVTQDAQQLRRGGSLWAKVGPYVFLFSVETRQLFIEYTGLAAVRVITRVGQADVANAILTADELSDVLWRRSLNIAGQARRDGTNRMTLLEDLVDWGESHTEYSYNERFTNR